MTEVSTVWEYNGVSLTLDLMDMETAERYEAALAAADEEERALPQEGKYSEIMRARCRVYRNLYDRIFGEGTAERLFGGRDNFRELGESYESFLNFVQVQTEAAIRQEQQRFAKFSPNRAARRTPQSAHKG